MTERPQKNFDAARQAEAAAWVLRLQTPDLADGIAGEWLAWCEADPRNRIAFEGMAELWDVSSKLDADSLIEPRRPANDGAVSFPFHGSMGRMAAIAAVLIAMIGSVWLLSVPRFETERGSAMARLETPVGGVQTSKLEDGSRIELGGKSALSVQYSRDRRLIIAEEGEAFFEVAKNRERPFIVQAGPVTVTAVGTAFSVQKEGNSVTILVTEGIVEVRATPSPNAAGATAAETVLHAAAGHRIRFDHGELTQSVEPVTADVVAPWREGRLEFRDEPLRLVVARINRYSARKLEISDPSIADLRVTSIVYDDRIDAWLDGIEAILPVRISRTADRAVIAPAIHSAGAGT